MPPKIKPTLSILIKQHTGRESNQLIEHVDSYLSKISCIIMEIKALDKTIHKLIWINGCLGHGDSGAIVNMTLEKTMVNPRTVEEKNKLIEYNNLLIERYIKEKIILLEKLDKTGSNHFKSTLKQ